MLLLLIFHLFVLLHIPKHVWLGLIAYGTTFSFGGLILIKALIEYKIKRAKIRKDIDYETRKNQAVISVTYSKWADELIKLNLCQEITQDSEKDLKPIQEFELKMRKIQTILISYGFILLLGLIISAFLMIFLN